VTRKRIVVEPAAAAAAAAPRDPRFDTAVNGVFADHEFRRNYAFLDDYRDDEIKQLKAEIRRIGDKDERRRVALERKLKSMVGFALGGEGWGGGLLLLLSLLAGGEANTLVCWIGIAKAEPAEQRQSGGGAQAAQDEGEGAGQAGQDAIPSQERFVSAGSQSQEGCVWDASLIRL